MQSDYIRLTEAREVARIAGWRPLVLYSYVTAGRIRHWYWNGRKLPNYCRIHRDDFAKFMETAPHRDPLVVTA